MNADGKESPMLEEPEPTVTVLHPERRFDAHTVADFRRTALGAEGDVNVDLSGVEFIDSSGLASLVTLFKRQQERGLQLRLLNPQDAVRLIFEVTQLDTVLPLEPKAVRSA
jgi:anti-sigma B factor antagonist